MLPERGVQLGDAVRAPQAPFALGGPADPRALQGVLPPLQRRAVALAGLFCARALSALMASSGAACCLGVTLLLRLLTLGPTRVSVRSLMDRRV
jgi:hypothetical protein